MDEKSQARVFNEKEKSGLSRKDFLAGVGTLGVIGALGGAALLSGCSQDNGDGTASQGGETWWLPAQWDHEADVVVLGFGVAGGGAALEASEAGSSVIILEAAPEEFAGGASTAFVGYLGRFTHAAQTMVISSLYTMDMATAKTIETEADRLIPLVDEAGIAWTGSADPSMALIHGAGMEFYRVFSQVVLDSNPQVFYETPAQELIVNPQTKEVLGVKAEQDGVEIFVKANKGVVIATGSFGANREMVNAYHLTPLVDYANDGSPYDNGDGLRMAMQIGARNAYMSMGLEWATWSYRAPSNEYNTSVRAQRYAYLPATDGSLEQMGGVMPTQFSNIYVNMEGKRFCNEQESYDHDKSQVPFMKFKGKSAEMPNDYINLPAFMIFDEAMFQSGPIGPHNLTMGWNGLRQHYNWSEDNVAELEKGWILKADTIEELAALMESNEKTMDVEGLKATIETFNTYAVGGEDPEFGRDPLQMMPLGSGPYYAIEITPCIYYTIGGLATNIDSQTLDWNNEPIPRLYSAGNVGQGSYTFPIGVSGCFGRGILAGRHAAGLNPWE